MGVSTDVATCNDVIKLYLICFSFQ